MTFIDEDFLLESDFARELYFDHATALPIIDYHCHLSPEELGTDRVFANMTQLWLAGDHYKWRAMRSNGVAERFCTGDASDWEKFSAWAQTVPRTLRNPLYHWTHLEMRFPFGICDRLLCEETAREIYETCNERLQQPEFSACGLLGQYDVELVCTTDDPTDSLEHHLRLRAQPSAKCRARVYPTWRPDRAIAVEDVDAYNLWLDKLEHVSGVEIRHYDDLMTALAARHDFFHAAGCRLSDHGLDTLYAEDFAASEIDDSFAKLRRRRPLDDAAAARFKSAVLLEFGRMDHAKGWVQQFHIGALRDTNTRLLAVAGPNAGFDSIGDRSVAAPLARFLDRLDQTNQLAKTILYNLNPRDNELYATMIGNFQDGSSPGKIQYGSAWWFLDQLGGMQRQLDALSNMGLLSRFVGMLTDSRSFVSYSRHEYFRRLLCNLLGGEVERGLLPRDLSLLAGLVRDVCYENARQYFPWPDGATG